MVIALIWHAEFQNNETSCFIKLSCYSTRHVGVWVERSMAPTHYRPRHQVGVSGQLHVYAAL
jgi:hypothetical protein